MFRLNPAPFCLLDEVDAPLDDANTERFCRMVKRMSTRPIPLHLAQQDCDGDGQSTDRCDDAKQSVSRIVAVDMESAAILLPRHKQHDRPSTQLNRQPPAYLSPAFTATTKSRNTRPSKSVERAFSTDHDDVLMRSGDEPVARQEPSFARWRGCPGWPAAKQAAAPR
jgi:hypothetical protein